MIFETFQINQEGYFYQAFRLLWGMILIHYWNSPQGIVHAVSFPWKILTLFLTKRKKKGITNEPSTINLILRIWRFEFNFSIGWHDDPWGLIL